MKVRTKARREANVKTAAQLFQEMGYERATMNELAKRVDGSNATLYGYFLTKEALFYESGPKENVDKLSDLLLSTQP